MHELGSPVVATSGNVSQEPICIDEREARGRLAHIADEFLMHNRPIVRPVEDSVVLAHREGLAFETAIESDTAPLSQAVSQLLRAGVTIHCMRDLTRGGFASALNEIAGTAGVSIALNEAVIPVNDAVRGACEILRLDPLYVANEGRFICFVPALEADRALAALRSTSVANGAVLAGQVGEAPKGRVTIKGPIGWNTHSGHSVENSFHGYAETRATE
jgi:hydrogenase maturation factor